MGRQLPICASVGDEIELLRFIATFSPIRVFRPFAQSQEALWIDYWERGSINVFDYSVWLQKFAWTPEFGETGGPGCPPERAGWYYVKNSSAAPVVEISRPPAGSCYGGRIYWAKNFSAPKGLNYDVAEFSRIVDQIWKWVRRNGHREKGDGSMVEPFFLPQAWIARSGETGTP